MSKKTVGLFGGIAIIGATGLSMIQAHEGLRTTAYLDPVGIPTICYGHTGPEVRVGQRVTKDYCERVLMSDVALHQQVLIPGSPKNCIGNVPLNQNQMDALTSFTFNVGTTKFCKSTMARKLKAKDYTGAGDEFPKWANATSNGKLIKLSGLVKRRTAEKRLFDTPSYPAATNVPSGALRRLAADLR